MGLMKQPQEPTITSTDVNDEPVLSNDALKTLAKFLDALMEADFEQNRNKRLVVDAY